MISNWCTDSGFCRWVVPRQSAPVSPPPMMTTCLPVARRSELGIEPIALAAPVLLRQVFHGEMNAAEFAAWNLKVARMFGTACKNDRVEVMLQIFHGNILADMRAGNELHAFGFHLRQSPVDDVLFQFEIRNAVAQQTADAIGLLIDRDRVAGAAKLLRGGQSSGAGAYDCYLFPGEMLRRLGTNPAFFESALDDAFLNLLDGDRRLIDAQNAGRFARRGTDSSSELRKIIGGMQLPDGILPAPAIHQVVPVGNDVVHRAAGVAERDAAIHATRALIAQFGLGKILINFEPVVDSLGHRTTSRKLASMLHEARGLTHAAPARASRSGADRGREYMHAASGSHPALV